MNSLFSSTCTGAKRQGPSGDDETRLAIPLPGLSGRKGLKIADIGCGTGASTLVLAQALDASVTAVDFLPDFLRDLDIAAARESLDERIETPATSMDALPFEEQSCDAIWSEGAIYNIGFANGIKAWHRFLKPDGILTVSELTWLTQEKPAELEQHWVREYVEGWIRHRPKWRSWRATASPPLDTLAGRLLIARCRAASQRFWRVPTRWRR